MVGGLLFDVLDELDDGAVGGGWGFEVEADGLKNLGVAFGKVVADLLGEA
jgi:hypothetical protein